MPKVKFSILVPELYHPLDFPISLFLQSSREYILGIFVSFLSAALLPEVSLPEVIFICL